MKLCAVMAVIWSAAAFGLSPLFDSSGLKTPHTCVEASNWTYVVVKKLSSSGNKTCYEMKGNWISPDAIVCTTHKLKPGMPFLYMRYVATREMEMDNGFPTPVDLWRDCPAEDIQLGVQSRAHLK